MRILIAGATGLVGSVIVAQCRERNIPVNYLSTKRNKLEQRDDYYGFYWNPEIRHIDPACFEGVTAIINLAGESISGRWTKKRKEKILSSRVNSHKTLALGLEKHGKGQIDSLLSASGINTYPDSLSEYYTEEETQTDKSFLGEVVSAWETEADSLAKFGLNITKIRIGLVLSEKGGALPKLVLPVKMYLGAAFGTGEQWQSWIHIEDLARMFLFLAENNLGGVYNGVAPNPVTNSKLLREIAEALHKPLLLPNVPKIVMKIALGEMADVLFASQRVCSRKIENTGFQFNYPNIRGALADLYSHDTPAMEGLNTTLDKESGR